MASFVEESIRAAVTKGVMALSEFNRSRMDGTKRRDPFLDALEAAPANSAMGLLRANVEALLGPGHDPAAATAMCVHAWALVHGLSVLLLDRQLPPDDALIAAALDPRPLLRATP